MAPFTSKRSLYTQVVYELGLRIVRGDVKSGHAFPTEADLSQEMGVSRTVTREAIKVLTEKGLVISRPKTGTLVQPRSNWNLLDPDVLNWEYEAGPRDHFLHRLTELRLIIEPAASELAAQRGTPDEVAAMEQAYEDMEASVDDIDAYIAADMRFHAAIVHAAHNDLLEQMVNIIRSALISSRKVTTQIPGSSRDALPLHRAVLDAIQHHQSQMACDAMRFLITRARADIDLIVSENGFQRKS